MAKKRRSNKTTQQIKELNEALQNNGVAQIEGPKKKKWTIHDLRTVRPLTPSQEDLFHAWFNKNNVVAYGSAGTGKTFLALYLALLEILQGNQQQILIVRSAVPTRDVGFLPGTLDEKIEQYELPYKDILSWLFNSPQTYDWMKMAGIIKFVPTSFIRGLTWDDAIVVVDEGENLTFHEINSVMTRIGENSRIIFAGDVKQSDLDGSKRIGATGMPEFLQAAKNIESFGLVEFNRHDIVRSDFVKSWITAIEDLKIA